MKTIQRFRTQKGECRKNVDEGLLVGRECVSLGVMPSSASGGLEPLYRLPTTGPRMPAGSYVFPPSTVGLQRLEAVVTSMLVESNQH